MRSQVLIAEDEFLFRELLLDMLRSENIGAAGAANGHEALEILRADRGFSVLLSDIRMPRMTGYELVDEALKIQPELKILMMTGYDIESPTNRVLQAREYRVLRKPFDLDRLTELLHEMLARP